MAKKISSSLKIRLCQAEIANFSNGEISARVLDSVRGDDVFVIQSHNGDVNGSILEQAILIDTAKRASAKSITAVCPFFAYARQDRKALGREPISARLLIDILVSAGADSIMSVDLHTGQIQGFMDGPFEHLTARPIITKYLSKNFSARDLVIVSPDAGRVKSAEIYSNSLGCEIAIVHKHRRLKSKGGPEARELIGNVKGKVCILADDMIDTAGTLCAAAGLLSQKGAKEIHAVATHGIFSGSAKKRLQQSKVLKVVVTNTLPQHDDIGGQLVVLDISTTIASAIKEVYTGGSVSSLFPGGNQF